jgi:predicted  nucleic acid-binding Zn-ribbon protein
MSTFQESETAKLEEANRKIKQLTISYNELMNSYKEQSNEINKLNNELIFFHREIRQHKQQWENMFYSPSPEGYAFEEANLERKRSQSK